jgi:2-dehydro-3-deoxyphosphogluconate aldolase/(4S)-4-hydroxy-2-oxoglutarate aldolase
MDMTTVCNEIARVGVMAGMRGAFPPDVALGVAEVMLEEGIHVFELTLNSERPIEAMQAIKARYGDRAIVGMGTVLSVADAQRVLGAGADFVVSPAFQPDVVDYVLKQGVAMIAGVLTPTECVQAWGAGVPLLKLFPVGALGIEYFKALYAPLNHMKFLCNGAMNEKNAAEFIQHGAVGAGMGGWLTGDGTWMASRLRSRAHLLLNAIDSARHGTSFKV